MLDWLMHQNTRTAWIDSVDMYGKSHSTRADLIHHQYNSRRWVACIVCQSVKLRRIDKSTFDCLFIISTKGLSPIERNNSPAIEIISFHLGGLEVLHASVRLSVLVQGGFQALHRSYGLLLRKKRSIYHAGWIPRTKSLCKLYTENRYVVCQHRLPKSK